MRLLLVDGTNAVMRRAQVATDAPPAMIAEDVTARIRRAALDLEASHIIVAFDSYERNIRQDILETYKDSRTNETRVYAVALAKRLQADGIAIWAAARYEADDVIASLVERFLVEPKRVELLVLSSDHDLLELVSAQTTCYTYAPAGSGKWLQPWTVADVLTRFGVLPTQLNDFFTLKGGKGLEGLKGIGEKKATQLIQEHGSIERLQELLPPGDWFKMMFYRAVRHLRTNAPVGSVTPTKLPEPVL